MPMTMTRSTHDPVTEALTEIRDLVHRMASSMEANATLLEQYIFQEVALLPSRILETDYTNVVGATSLTVHPQTNDLEIIRGLLLTAPASASVTVTVGSLGIPLVVPSGGYVLLAPLDLLVATRGRTATFSALTAGEQVSLTLWGNAAPARTGAVH